MTLVAKVDNVALPDGALLIGGAPNSSVPGGIVGLPTAAYFGEAMFGGLSIDDPEGAYDFDGLHTFTVDETADTDRPRIWNGLLTGRRVHRGPYSSGPSRVWDVDIWEMNLLFALMVFRASSAKRPYETDLVRAQYIMESAPMAFTPSVDNGRANYTDNPINFDESDLVTKFPIEALNEFASIAGKNFYNYWDQDAEENSIHYDLIGVGPAATVTITNDEADTLDSTTFRPFLDAELDEGAEWTVTGMLLAYKGAYAYDIRQATIDALSPTIFSPTQFQRDEVYRTDRVGRLATAQALIVQMLNDRAVDRATIKCSIRVPAAVVNEGIEAGDLVTVKFTHLPGYEAESDIPIIRRNVVPTEGRVDMYDVHLELSGVGKPTGPGGGGPGPFPQQPPDCSGAWLLDPGVYSTNHAAAPIPMSGTFTIPAGGTSTFSYSIEAADIHGFDGWPAGGTGGAMYVYLDGAGGQVYFPSPGGTPPGGYFAPGLTSGPWSVSGEITDPLILAQLRTGGTWQWFWANGDNRESWQITATYGEIWYTDDGPCGADEDACPSTGVWKRNEVVGNGDGTTTSFFTLCPYALGSLIVKVDGVPVVNGLTEVDNTTGEFSLDFAPKAASGDTRAEVITCDYQGI